jgi:hypothetical protein
LRLWTADDLRAASILATVLPTDVLRTRGAVTPAPASIATNTDPRARDKNVSLADRWDLTAQWAKSSAVTIQLTHDSRRVNLDRLAERYEFCDVNSSLTGLALRDKGLWAAKALSNVVLR